MAAPPTNNQGDAGSAEATAPVKRLLGGGPVSGAAVMLTAKIAGMVVSIAAVAVVARILTPADFGLIAMVISLTAFLQVFSDLGLSLVTVQRREISQDQLSTLFWINLGFGILLGLITLAVAPALVWFYNDARLSTLTVVVAAVFPITALGIQHFAVLKRNMRFPRMATVRLIATVSGAGGAILAALAGWGYWALVVQLIVAALVQSSGAWIASGWRPHGPRGCEDLKSLLSFGGFLTAHTFLGYFARNIDKVLLGKFAGPFALGLYAKAYDLMLRPIMLAGYSVGEAAIPALSRSQDDGDRLRATYRRMFSVTCLLGFPACVAGILWADDIVLTLLGDQWLDAIILVRILFGAAIARMLAASTGWVFVATGRPGRMLRWQLMWTPFVTIAFVIALPHGASGIAIAYAVALWVAIIPNFAYCFRGTELRLVTDVFAVAWPPALCTLVACFAATAVQILILPDLHSGPVRLAVRMALAAVPYVATTVVWVPLASEGWHKVVQALRTRMSSRRRVAQAVGTVDASTKK